MKTISLLVAGVLLISACADDKETKEYRSEAESQNVDPVENPAEETLQSGEATGTPVFSHFLHINYFAVGPNGKYTKLCDEYGFESESERDDNLEFFLGNYNFIPKKTPDAEAATGECPEVSTYGDGFTTVCRVDNITEYAYDLSTALSDTSWVPEATTCDKFDSGELDSSGLNYENIVSSQEF